MPEGNYDPSNLFVGNVATENATSNLYNYYPANEEGEYAHALAKEIVVLEEGAGLLLVGAPGNGKSHLAVGIARAVVENGGRAAFIPFRKGGLDFDVLPPYPTNSSNSWQSDAELLVSLFDLIALDDLPGKMSTGTRIFVRQLVVAAFNQGKKLVFSSNRPTSEVVRQIAERSDGKHDHDIAVGVVERMLQTWQTVEFTGESYRSTRPKWWRRIPRPASMPNTLGDLAAEMAAAADYPRLLGAAIVEIAEHVGASGPNLANLSETLTERDAG
jgi:DNA replication protein DnaC